MSNVNNTVIFRGFSISEVEEIVKAYDKDFSITEQPDGTQVVSKAFTTGLKQLVGESDRGLTHDLQIVGVVKRRLGDLEFQWGYIDELDKSYGTELNKDEVLYRLRIVDEACERLLMGLTEESLIGVSAEDMFYGTKINIDLPVVKEFVAKVRELQGKVEEFRETL